MSSTPPPAPDKIDNDTYLRLWQLEQEHGRTRWTIATFFMGISFAIFGFSFQKEVAPLTAGIARITGLVIYWFAYMLFLRFFSYGNTLRGYIRELEQADRTTL